MRRFGPSVPHLARLKATAPLQKKNNSLCARRALDLKPAWVKPEEKVVGDPLARLGTLASLWWMMMVTGYGKECAEVVVRPAWLSVRSTRLLNKSGKTCPPRNKDCNLSIVISIGSNSPLQGAEDE